MHCYDKATKCRGRDQFMQLVSIMHNENRKQKQIQYNTCILAVVASNNSTKLHIRVTLTVSNNVLTVNARLRK